MRRDDLTGTNRSIGTRSYTTNYLEKQKDREEVSDQVAEFLAKGGNIKEVEQVSVKAAMYKSKKPQLRTRRNGETYIVRQSNKWLS
jgi:hypothetical protein